MKNKKPNFTDKELDDLFLFLCTIEWDNIKQNKLIKGLQSIQKKLGNYYFPELKEEKEE